MTLIKDSVSQVRLFLYIQIIVKAKSLECNPGASACKRKGQECDPYTRTCRNNCTSHGDCKGKDEKCDSSTHICTACPILVCHSDAHPIQTSCSKCKCLRGECYKEYNDANTNSWTAKGGCPTCECDVGYAGDGEHCGLDSDMDGRPDVDLDCEDPQCKRDNCMLVPNPDQKDRDKDGTGNVCTEDKCSPYPDSDGDGVGDACDNCKDKKNKDQSNIDGDAFGDFCDDDMDGDGVNNKTDNCPKVPNRNQLDTDKDGIGDECDNCPLVSNPDQSDKYFTGFGDACQIEKDGGGIAGYWDGDYDGIPNRHDNCRAPRQYNPEQLDTDKVTFSRM